MYNVKILLDSINEKTGDRITTWELTYPRFVHSELMTHRTFSRNSASSRAIPIKKMMERIRKDPVKPVWWGANQAGMQAKESLKGWRLWLAQQVWLLARYPALFVAWFLMKIGLHKQIANRILEPWMYITVIVTATEFENWFKLRCHPDAQPEINWVAVEMKRQYDESTPQVLKPGQWHIPMVNADDFAELEEHADSMGMVGIEKANFLVRWLLKIATGRLARVSYLTHDGKRALNEDVVLHDRLAGSGHWSPFEHCAKALDKSEFWGNTKGFMQYRKCFSGEAGVGTEKVQFFEQLL